MLGKDDRDSPIDIIIAEFDSSSAGGQRANMEFARKLSNQRGIDLDIIGRHIRREAADDSRDERLTYVTYQEVRSILASLVVYVRKAIIKVYPYRGDARQVSEEPDYNNREDRLLVYIGKYAN